MVLGLNVVGLMDGHRGVDDLWLESLLVDDWDDSFVDVVVDVLASDGWCCLLAVGRLVGS